ncbi:MAG: Fic family protein, partial [Clostridia bacterium]|nr:Fic family protein [Clostridia bacterium]
SRLTSTYVDVYSDDLYDLLLRNAREARELRKQIRNITKQLSEAGYQNIELPFEVLQNMEYARANMKLSIYEQAVLEGVATTFPQTETIIENGEVSGMKATDIQKVLNLKHAWEFILDSDVLLFPSSLSILMHIAQLVNEGFYANGGQLRTVPVSIGGTSYVPPFPIEPDIIDAIHAILETPGEAIDRAIDLCLYCMKAQLFLDGNKRASIIFANHYLISQGGGLLVVPESEVPTFKKLLVQYYENPVYEPIHQFMRDKCWKPIK